MPIVLLLSFGLLAFGLFLSAYGTATFASRMAVRYAVMHGSTSLLPCAGTDLSSIVSQYMFPFPGVNAATTVSWPGGNSPGNPVTVTVTLKEAVAIPYSTLTSLQTSTTAQGIIIH